MSMLGEITHLQTLTDDLKTLTMDPHKLPASSEQVQLSQRRLSQHHHGLKYFSKLKCCVK